MGSTGRIADAEYLNVVSQFAEGGCCRCASKTGSYYDDLEFSAVVGADKVDFRLALGPFFGKRSVRNF